MGVLTDFVIADRSDARRVLDSDCPCEDFGGLDAKGIDTVNLATLHAILTGGDLDPSFMGKPTCSGGENGPWVIEVPPDLVRRLAGLDEAERRSGGRAWAATEEFSARYCNWPPEAVQQFLDDLARLCEQAIGEDKAVFMWMCL